MAVAGNANTTVLVVEDDEKLRELIRTSLEAAGYRVVEASRIAAARGLLSSERPAAIVLDGLLPDMTGIAWLTELRSAGDPIPVVFVSAFWRDLASYRMLVDQLRVARVLYKPVSARALVEGISQALGADVVARQRRSDPVERLRELRERYHRELPERLREIADAVRAAAADPSDAALREQATVLAHRLHGTAGSYGLPEVGAAAGRLEARLRDDPSPLREVEPAVVDLRRSAARPSDRPAPATVPPGPARSTMLLVDDDEDFLACVRQLASTASFPVDVAVARTVEEALDVARHRDIQVALLDVWLGSEPTFGLARQLRSIRGHEDMPVAFVSAHGRLVDRVAAAHAGGQLFLDKPLDEDALEDAIRQLVHTIEARQPRVLVVDGDDVRRRRTAAILDHAGFQVDEVADPAALPETLERAEPDAVVIDDIEGRLGPLDVCRALRTAPQWQDLPIVLVTAHHDPHERIAAFEAGVDDWVERPAQGAELVARLRVRTDRRRLIRERRERDALTGLLLRTPFVEAVRARLSEAQRRTTPVAIAMIDLDRFKQVNDTHGHLAGDRVLAGVGALLRRRLRAYDLRARWGGEEIAVALPGEDAATAAGVMEMLLDELRQTRFEADSGEAFHVTFTAGIACYPDDGDTLEGLLGVADRRMYAGKDAGRDRVVHAD